MTSLGFPGRPSPAMKITYDQDADALYMEFKATTVTTEHVAEGIAADYDAEGCLAGIEILDALKRAGQPPAFEHIRLEDITSSAPESAA